MRPGTRLAVANKRRHSPSSMRGEKGSCATISQGVRAFSMRRSRSIGLEKTHLQQVGIAAAINVDRAVARARWRSACSHTGVCLPEALLCRLAGLPAVSKVILVAKSKRDWTSSVSMESMKGLLHCTKVVIHVAQICADPPVPEETARVAQAVFPHGNVFMQVRDTLGTIYTDEAKARPVSSPWSTRFSPVAPGAGDGLPIYGRLDGSANR
jgi:hypothetical protein